MMRAYAQSSVLILALLIFPLAAAAAIPQTINYQGYLTDSGGLPSAGPVSLTFKLYDVASGGSALWTETHTSVALTNGVYNVILGNGNPTPVPITLPFDAQYWLGIAVNGGAEMTPRQALSSVPYSFRAKQADGVGSAVQIAPSQITSGTAAINISGNAATAATATQLAADPADCAANSVAGGINASGVAQGCIPTSSTNTANAIVRRDASGNFAAGTVTASGDFAFTAAKTRYLSIPPAAFVQASGSTVVYGTWDDAAYITGSTDIKFFAPLVLPHGVTLTEVRCGLFNNTVVLTQYVQVLSKPRTGWTVTSVFSGSTPTTSPNIQDVAASGSHLIDADNVYTIAVYTPNLCGTNCKVTGCRVTYTETTVH